MKLLQSKKLSKAARQDFLTYGMVIAAFAVVQTLVSTGNISSLMKGLLVPICVYAVLAVSLNLTVGILGELSLGHASFMCIGAFAGAFFSKCVQQVITVGWLRITIAMILGAVFAGILGFLIGMPVLRLKGDYLAIVTLGFGEIVKTLVNALYIGRDENGLHFSLESSMDLNMSENGEVIIKGAQGITGTPKDASFLIGVILLLITLAVVLNLIRSRDGRAIMAIRDNRIAAESVGINITKYKLMAFTVSAALAGAAGALYAHNINTLTANTNNFGYNMSINILVFVVLGGIGNIRGSVIGAALLTILPELLRSFNLDSLRMLIYAIILILVMLFNWAPSFIAFRERISAAVKAKLPKKGGNR